MHKVAQNATHEENTLEAKRGIFKKGKKKTSKKSVLLFFTYLKRTKRKKAKRIEEKNQLLQLPIFLDKGVPKEPFFFFEKKKCSQIFHNWCEFYW